jgi:tetratricopeptide (TPR) repeat protein
MDPKNHKRFTYRGPFQSDAAKSSLEDLLAKLPKLDEDNPIEKELSGLLKDSLGWLNIFKEQAPVSFGGATSSSSSSRPSRRPRGSGEAPSGEEIQSLMEAGKLAKAKRAARQVLQGVNVKEAIAQEASSVQTAGTVTGAVQVLALIAQMQGDTEKAERAYRLLVKLYSSHAGPDSEATLQFKYSLAELYADDNTEKAIELLDEVIASCDRVRATDSRICAAAKSLGGALRSYDEDSELLDEAAAYLGDAEAVQRLACESDPEAWLELVTTVTRLAQLASLRDESEVARSHYERAIEIYRKHGDQEDGQITVGFATVLMEYGQRLLRSGENSSAIRAGRESVRLIRSRFGPLSAESIPFLLALGHLYRDTQEPEGIERACQMFKKVVLLHEQHFRNLEDYLAEAPSLLDAHKGLVLTYLSLESYGKAEAAAHRALRVVVDLDDEPVERHQIYKMLAFVCELDNRPDEAQQYEELAKEVWGSSDSLSAEDEGEYDDADSPDDEDVEDEGEDGERDEDDDDDDEDDDDDQWWRGGPQNDDNDE